MSNPSDISLLTRWIAECEDDLLGYLVRRLHCRETAADLCQETFLRLLDSGLWAQARHPNALAYRVARNVAIDHVRRQRTEARHRSAGPFPADLPGPAPTPEKTLEAQQRLACLEQAIGVLTAQMPPRV